MSEPASPSGLATVVLSAQATYDLRRCILRAGDPEADVSYPTDAVASAFHLGLVDDAGAVVGVASFAPADWPARGAGWAGGPGGTPWRLRGMAIDPRWQGQSWGERLLDEGVRRVRSRGASVLWADARDTALGFYERQGWEIVGDSFLTPIGVAHHFAVLRLDLARSQ